MKSLLRLTILALIAGIFLHPALAQVRLPKLVSNGMVLQRDKPVNLWGWAAPNERLIIKFNKKSYKATAGSNGNWSITLPPMKAGGPYTMEITASNSLEIKDILLGDVWFCAGQSNMVINMERVKEKYPDEIASANYPQIRNFFIPTISDVSKVYDDLPPGQWVAASPKDVLGMGAVTYFFAKQLYLKYHIPIGIINSSVGGTPIQAWISEDGLREIPSYAARVAQFKDTVYLNSLKPKARPKSNIAPAKVSDLGLTGAKTWFDTTYVPLGWHNFWLPGYWADQGVRGLNGVVWFRKEVMLPAAAAGQPAKLFLGRIIDADEAYVNGKLVGNTTYQYPPRRYEVPANVLKAGKNVIVVRITNNGGKGGFVPDKPYKLVAGGQTIDLRGDWLYQVGQVFTPQPYTPETFSAQNEPTGLYNTMVAPAISYNIKGIAWYQGEANTGKPAEYAQLLPALIADWRKQWKQPALPFVYAQLPNFMEVQYLPSESSWAWLRETQLKTLSVPHTGMAVAIDAGEWNDIHPLNKKVVGERLALAAQKVAYGDDKTVASGPIFKLAEVQGGKVIITFSATGSALTVKGGGELKQFAIAGADKKFVWATAKIEGDRVIVYSDNVPNPAYVRYAWADNPEGANLYNVAGLPASPFRTDQ